MLTCAHLTDRLLDYELGELDAPLRGEIEAHLSECPTCANFHQTYRVVSPLVQHALEVRVDDALQAELEAACLALVQQRA
jgi:anti-sigma factor RsiW